MSDFDVQGQLSLQIPNQDGHAFSILVGLNNSKKQNVESILILDFCCRTHVEEVVLLCRTLKNGGNDKSTTTELSNFEDYVLELLENYADLSEIFKKV